MDEYLRSEVQPSDMQQRQERLHTEKRESQRHSQRFAVWEGFQLAVADRLLQHFNEN